MENSARFGDNLFEGANPIDVAFDTLWVTHREFWLVAGDGPGADVSTAIPVGDSLAHNGEAVGIPTLAEGFVNVALSAWASRPPHAQGFLLGSCSINANEREVSLINVEGREPGPVLVLEEAGEHQVSVWRSIPQNDDDFEMFDIRIWLGPISSQGPPG
ncbi:hypothetical protein [Streptomyces exfoliatus]|uniref:hypothetical protein n=1 Tax=Streptomyces exfoliatus TaxID=1905 RepID=UPI003C2CFF18